MLQNRILQRKKALVAPDILEKEEKIIWVELTKFQKTWYKLLSENAVQQ